MLRSAIWPPAPCAKTKSPPPADASAGSKTAEVSSSPTLTRHEIGALTAGGVKRNARLFQAILDLGEGPAGAFLVEISARGAAHAEAADGSATGHDGRRGLPVGYGRAMGLPHVG